MSSVCKGCGIHLQYEDPTKLGYTPKIGSDYCQRCFRLTHYNDIQISMQQGIDRDVVLSKINPLDALVVWVVDVMDFEASIFKGINRHLMNKDILLVCTKSDLLPKDTNPYKLAKFIQQRLKWYGIKVQGIIMCPNLHKQEEESIRLVEDAIIKYREERDVVVIGNANAGKSTLLNGLLKNNHLTTSMHPGTTLDLNPIQFDLFTLYDTPGLVNQHSVLTYCKHEDLKTIVMHRQVNPKKFQLLGDQTLSIGGLARIDFIGCEQLSVVCYVSSDMLIHRSKSEFADELWKNHLKDGFLNPKLSDSLQDLKMNSGTNKYEKTDIVISGLGWFCMSGNVKEIKVYVHKNVDVIFREAMI